MKRFWGVSIENIPIPYLKLEKLGFLIRYRVFLMVMVQGVVASVIRMVRGEAEIKIYKFLYTVASNYPTNSKHTKGINPIISSAAIIFVVGRFLYCLLMVSFFIECMR